MGKKSVSKSVQDSGGGDVPVSRLEQPSGLAVSEDGLRMKYWQMEADERVLADIASGRINDPSEAVPGLLGRGRMMAFKVSPLTGLALVEEADFHVVSSSFGGSTRHDDDRVYSFGCVVPGESGKPVIDISRAGVVPEYGCEVSEQRTVDALHAIGVPGDSGVRSPRIMMSRLFEDEGGFSFVVDHDERLVLVDDLEAGHAEIISDNVRGGDAIISAFKGLGGGPRDRECEYTRRFTWGVVQPLLDDVSGLTVNEMQFEQIASHPLMDGQAVYLQACSLLSEAGMPDAIRLSSPDNCIVPEGVHVRSVHRGRTPQGVEIPSWTGVLREGSHWYTGFRIPSVADKIGLGLLHHARAVEPISGAGEFEVYNDDVSEPGQPKMGGFRRGDFHGVSDGEYCKTSGASDGGFMYVRVRSGGSAGGVPSEVTQVFKAISDALNRDYSKKP
ncbi:MAG: hypothetical protein GF416_02840 [Candidatus Altiarchaeales archaeon]|nr:hypothetical protein [Candidatus Altiarchaeales archaeon]MBD3416056.1 hypothetical protein [Candidatus Altiarchaeales archaeon]